MNNPLNALVEALRAFLEALIGSLGSLTPKNASSSVRAPEKVSRVEDVSLLKKWEGLRLESYQDVAGVWTIGYGHTKTAEPGMKITAGGAEQLLRHDLDWVERVINTSVKVELTQYQYDALASFVYNIGGPAFKKSTMLRKLNSGDYKGAAEEFPRWNKAGGKVVRGLTRRRKAEMEWFRNGRN